MEELLKEIKRQVYEIIDINYDLSEEELFQTIDDCIFKESRRRMLSIKIREDLRMQVFNSIRRLDILQELLEDDTITEIMINGCDNIFIEKNGHIIKWDKCFESQAKLSDIAQRIAALSNKLVNEASPIVDTRLGKYRVNIVLPPVAISGPVITIRKFYDTPITVEKLIEYGSLSKIAADFLERAVVSKYNIFVSGGTGSGKTTFLNALSNFIPKDERVITIEDSAELQINEVANLVRLEARSANQEGENAVTIRDLIKSSLRMRPDRIVVGEVRGEEAIDMLQAMNTGHDGSLSTGHSNSTKDMLTRLETMVLMGMDMPVQAIRQQIGSAIDIIVHLGRLRDKSRRVLEITEVVGYEDGQIRTNPLFRFKESGEEDGRVVGELVKLQTNLINKEKMSAFWSEG